MLKLLIGTLLSLNLVACGHKSDDAKNAAGSAAPSEQHSADEAAGSATPTPAPKTQAQIYQEYWAQFIFKYNGCDSNSVGRSFNFMISDDIDFHLIEGRNAYTYKSLIINLHEDSSYEAYIQTFEGSSANYHSVVVDTKILTGKSILDTEGKLHLSNIGTLTPKLGDIFVKLQVVDNFFNESAKGQVIKMAKHLDYENPGFPELKCDL